LFCRRRWPDDVFGHPPSDLTIATSTNDHIYPHHTISLPLSNSFNFSLRLIRAPVEPLHPTRPSGISGETRRQRQCGRRRCRRLRLSPGPGEAKTTCCSPPKNAPPLEKGSSNTFGKIAQPASRHVFPTDVSVGAALEQRLDTPRGAEGKSWKPLLANVGVFRPRTPGSSRSKPQYPNRSKPPPRRTMEPPSPCGCLERYGDGARYGTVQGGH
jgi:hypothetical protein